MVGLGNPDQAYADTRHNFGFLVLDMWAAQAGQAFTRHPAAASLFFQYKSVNGLVLAAKPQTYMNRSGEAVSALSRLHQVDRKRLLVVYDDLDLPFGQLRLRPGGGPGSHKGMQSICQELGSDFPRLRLGLGSAPASVERAAFVLSPFTAAEQAALPDVLAQAIKIILCTLERGLEAAMQAAAARAT